VRVDGKRAAVGTEIDPHRSAVLLDGRRVRPAADATTIVLNKPAGVITTLRDEHGRKTVAALLPKGVRLFPVGRLDAATTGLLVCTNDGDLANFLLAPKHELPRTYRVTVRGELNAGLIRSLGARRVTKRPDGASAFNLVLREGRNRQVRRLCARSGLRVIELVRTHFGPIALGSLQPGSWRMLTEEERKALERARYQGQVRDANPVIEHMSAEPSKNSPLRRQRHKRSRRRTGIPAPTGIRLSFSASRFY
jgi:23S rRNA pseudouridine2605 synthase